MSRGGVERRTEGKPRSTDDSTPGNTKARTIDSVYETMTWSIALEIISVATRVQRFREEKAIQLCIIVYLGICPIDTGARLESDRGLSSNEDLTKEA